MLYSVYVSEAVSSLPRFPTNILYAFLASLMRATFSAIRKSKQKIIHLSWATIHSKELTDVQPDDAWQFS